MTRSLQGPGSQNSPEPFADLVTRLQSVQRELGDVTSAVLRSAGIRVAQAAMTIERALRVLGRLDVEGELRVTGPTRIEGPLSLPAGIIDNEALARPIVMDSEIGSGAAFSVPNGWADLASCTIVVPAGFTRAYYTAIATVLAQNTAGSTQYLFSVIRYQADGAGPIYGSVSGQTTLPAGYWGTAMATQVWSMPVTPGESLRFWVEGGSGATLPAAAGNYARIEVAMQFSR